MLLYVDDPLLVGNNNPKIAEIKYALSAKYEMKYLGALQCYLGVEFIRDAFGMHMHQTKYVIGLLSDQGLLQCKASPTPLPKGFTIQSKTNTPSVDRTLYYQIVDKLLYLINTCPELSYSVGIVARYMLAPQQHLDVVYHILRYLKGTMDYGLYYQAKRHVKLEGYIDFAYLDYIEIRCSTRGYLFQLVGNSITWSLKRQ